MKDLYDRKKELRNLENAIESGKIVLLTGIRRIGKTSLLNVFLNERKVGLIIYLLIAGPF